MYKELRGLGLSENEINVYVSLLELGTSKVDLIAKRSELPRTTVYGLLSLLSVKGLVSYVIKSGVKYYESTSPSRFLLSEEEKLKELKKIVPELLSLQKSVGEKPSVEMYEGKEGLKSVYEDMLKTGQSIYGYGTTSFLLGALEFYIPNYMKQRAKKGIFSFIITEDSKLAREMKERDKSEKRETRFLEGLEQTNTVTYIYGNNLAIIGLLKKYPIGIIIKNEDFSKSHKSVFDILWKIAKKS